MGQPSIPKATRVPHLRGRPFANGNSGRKPGSRNRTTLVAAALLDGEAGELVRKAIAVAESGNVPMLKFLLGRILPRDRLIKIELPRMEFSDDSVEALGNIMRAVSEGAISPTEAAQLATVVNCYSKAIDIADLVKRLDSLEAAIKGVRAP